MKKALVLCALLLAGCTVAKPAPPPPTAVRPSAPRPSSADPNEPRIAALLARPMRLPTVATGAACPVAAAVRRTPASQPGSETGFGAAPIYPLAFYLGATAATFPLNTASPGPDGLYEHKVVWASNAGLIGEPAVVRVGRLDGPGRGRVRLYYDPTASRGDAVVFFTYDRVPADWPSGTFLSGPGCYAYQVDWATGTELIVFRAVVAR